MEFVPRPLRIEYLHFFNSFVIGITGEIIGIIGLGELNGLESQRRSHVHPKHINLHLSPPRSTEKEEIGTLVTWPRRQDRWGFEER